MKFPFGLLAVLLVAWSLSACSGGGTAASVPQAAPATQNADSHGKSKSFVNQAPPADPPGSGTASPSPCDASSPSCGDGGAGPYNFGCFDSPDLCLPVVQIAVRTPVSGANCLGSSLTLGDNWPINTTDTNHMVVNILALVFTQSGGGTSTWAWLYTEQGGTVYIQENASYRSAFEGFVSGIPALAGVGAALANGHGGVVPISSSDGQAVLNDWRAQSGQKAGSCFKAPLNPANA